MALVDFQVDYQCLNNLRNKDINQWFSYTTQHYIYLLQGRSFHVPEKMLKRQILYTYIFYELSLLRSKYIIM